MTESDDDVWNVYVEDAWESVEDKVCMCERVCVCVSWREEVVRKILVYDSV